MKPYTYLVKFKPTGQCYYGARFKNVRLGINPEDDLMIKYQTSSNDINNLILQYGLEAFEWEVRKTFDTPEQAIDWETRVLKRCKVLESKKWFNSNIAGYIIPTEESRKKISDYHKDKLKSEEHKRRLSESQKGKTKTNSKNQTPEYRALMSALKSGSKNSMYGKHHSEETKAKISALMSERIKGDNNPMRKVEWTEERRAHMRQVRAQRGPMTAEQIEKTAAKNRGKRRPKLYCEHCGRDIAVGWFHRHGPNCRHNPANT
jgi:hypothetical protein